MQTATTTEAGPREFHHLTLDVRAAGLFERRLGYYWVKVVVTVAAFGAGWLGFFLLGDSWATLAIAVFLGVAATQLGFLGHDAGHRQIFESRRANRLLGLGVGNALIGMSYGWWVPKHNSHHAHPNEPGIDPDIGVGLPSAGAHRDDAPGGKQRGVARWLDRWQAQLFFPLMLLRSTGLYVSGFQDVIRRRRERSVLTEGLLLVAHLALYATVVFWVLSPLKAIAFIAVHQAAFSLYLGCSFAPNHKGMPLVEDGTEMCFARRQVVTARNLSGGRLTGFIFGGLNYQIEHHLFPTMPRPNLARAQAMVRAFCRDNHLGYTEARPLASYVLAVRALKSPDPFAPTSVPVPATL
ncbi:MAG TPA: acyl-CoA desaturase [Acidimicrobiales bacterium]|nr:acyl-CoA desaturase [Acidimicrobiales bacterium]